MDNLRAANGYLLLKRIETDSGVVTQADAEEKTHQKWQIIHATDGYLSYGVQTRNDYFKPGMVVFVQQHSDSDTPKELIDQGLGLVHMSRVIAVEEAK